MGKGRKKGQHNRRIKQRWSENRLTDVFKPTRTSVVNEVYASKAEEAIVGTSRYYIGRDIENDPEVIGESPLDRYINHNLKIKNEKYRTQIWYHLQVSSQLFVMFSGTEYYFVKEDIMGRVLKSQIYRGYKGAWKRILEDFPKSIQWTVLGD